MPKIAAGLLGIVIALAVQGCAALEPRYREKQIAFDEALVGAWEEVPEGEPNDKRTPSRFAVSPRTVEVKDGRLNPDTGASNTVTPATPNSYRIEVGGPEGHAITFDAYIIELGPGRRLAGFQVAGEMIEKAGGPFLALPLHHFLKFERDGDEVKLWYAAPPAAIAWMPWIHIPGSDRLHASPESPSEDDDQVETGFLRISDSIDRVLSYYERHWDDRAFWSDEPTRYRRVPAP